MYIRDSSWEGHTLGDNYRCSKCLIAQNSWHEVGKCKEVPSSPPFNFSFGKPPNDKKAKFCKSGHVRSSIFDLTDLDNLECNASTKRLSPYLAITTNSGLLDKYKCSHCHVEFEDECMHSIG